MFDPNSPAVAELNPFKEMLLAAGIDPDHFLEDARQRFGTTPATPEPAEDQPTK